MAVTKLWKVENRLDHVIDYATDKNKTEKLNSMREVLNYAMNEEKTRRNYYYSVLKNTAVNIGSRCTTKKSTK